MSNKINIIIAEKPSMWKNIANGLFDKFESKNWYLLSPDKKTIITWWVWHLVSLKLPNEINSKWKMWNFENLPMFINFKENYKVEWNAKKQFNIIKTLFLNCKTKGYKVNVFHAWDPDREWELITRLIMKQLKDEIPDLDGVIEKEYRLWLKDFAKKTIEEEFKKLNEIKNFDNLYYSALARQHSDYIVWMNLTAYYSLLIWLKKETFNVWRVQSAILRLLVDRDLEIRNFKDSFTYRLIWTFNNKENNIDNFIGIWFSEKTKDWILKTINLVETVKKDLILEKENEKIIKYKNPFKVEDKKKDLKKEYLNWLYTLVDIQVDAEKRFWYSPWDTLKYLQWLYHNHWVLSYPRTDSWFIEKSDYEKLEEALYELWDVSYYDKLFEKFFEKKYEINPSSNFVTEDKSKLGSHSWIYILKPTKWTLKAVFEKLNIQEKNIFTLVLERIIACMVNPYIYESSELILKNWVHLFKIQGKVLIDKWFKDFYMVSNKENNDIILPNLEVWDIVNLNNLEIKEVKKTKPKYYTKWTLAKTIDNLANLFDKETHPELHKRIVKISPKWERQLWLWTPATRASIIDKLQESWFITEKSKKLYPLSKGYKLLSVIDENMADPITTAEWEDNLRKIMEWEFTYQEFIKDIKEIVKNLLNKKEHNLNLKYFQNEILWKDNFWLCPKCWIWEIREFDKWYSCSSQKCSFIIWKNISSVNISKDIVKEIIEDWKTKKEFDFTKKDGKTKFKAWLKLDKNYKIAFDFRNK